MFLKFIETRRCLSVPSIAYGVASNVAEVPICFRDVASKILRPCRLTKVKPCNCIPDCYDMEIPRGLGFGSLLANPRLRGSAGNLISWNGSKFISGERLSEDSSKGWLSWIHSKMVGTLKWQLPQYSGWLSRGHASKKQHKVLCMRLKAKKVILRTIPHVVGGSIYTSYTLNQLEELGLDAQKAHRTALELHAHSVLYAHKLTTIRCALEKSS